VLALAAAGAWAEPSTQLRGDALATLLYVANWHFIAQGANYFTATGPTSPLTHTWTLAVEEQFYILWPLLVIGVLALAGRARRGLLVVLCVGGALLSAVAMATSYRVGDATRLYYGTDTHAEPLLLGAALAAVLSARSVRSARRRPSRWGPVEAHRRGDHRFVLRTPAARVALGAAGLAGLGALTALWTTVGGQTSFLYRGGFLLDGAIVTVIVWSLVSVPRGLLTLVLGLRPLRAVGRASYGIYLWHVPLFLFLDARRTGLHSTALLGLRLAAVAAAATASYHLVEQPMRRASWFRGWKVRLVVPGAAGCLAGALVLTGTPGGNGTGLAVGAAASTKPSSAVAQAAGPAPVRVLLVGDSMAQTLGNGMEGLTAATYGAILDNQGIANCSLAMGTFRVQNYPPRESAPACQPGSGDPGWPADWASVVASYRPDVSVFLGRLDIVDRLFQGRWTHIGDPSYDAYLVGQMRLAVQTLSAGGGKVVLLTSPYYDSGEQPDGAPWPEDNPARVDTYNGLLRQVAAAYPGVVSVVDLNALADPAGHYQSTIDGIDVRFTDGIHWTFAGDAWLAPRILPPIVQVGRSAQPIVDGRSESSPSAFPAPLEHIQLSASGRSDSHGRSSRPHSRSHPPGACLRR
jgi:peptidoglycan/LPS O-acetylase OafA/YrhL